MQSTVLRCTVIIAMNEYTCAVQKAIHDNFTTPRYYQFKFAILPCITPSFLLLSPFTYLYAQNVYLVEDG